jgi:hypothetical protein
MNKPEIQRIEIIPADNGGFMIEIMRRPSQQKQGSDNVPSESYESRMTKVVAADCESVCKQLHELFPAKSSTMRQGKQGMVKDNRSRIDTFEGE